MGHIGVSPFISFLEEAPDDGNVIFRGDYEDDRTLRMINCLVRSSKTLRDMPILKNILLDLKSLPTIQALVQTVLAQHLQTPLSDNSVLEEFLSKPPGLEICRFHLLHATRTFCADICFDDEAPGDWKKIETNTYVEGMLRKQDCVLLVSEIHKYKFKPANSIYLFECVAHAKGVLKNYVPPNRLVLMTPVKRALEEKIAKKRADTLFHLIDAGVYAAMFLVCLRNDRNRRLINKFLDVMQYGPDYRPGIDIAYYEENHPVNNALISIFKIPGNLVKLQMLVYYACVPPCTSEELEDIYSSYCHVIRMIFLCVQLRELSFSDSDQFNASKWMIFNLEKMCDMRDYSNLKQNIQYAICTYMNLATIDMLFQEGYIQRLVDIGFDNDDTFQYLMDRWNEIPNNTHPWTMVISEGKLLFLGVSPPAQQTSIHT